MRTTLTGFWLGVLSLLTIEAAQPTLLGSPAGLPPRCKHRDFSLTAGKASPKGCYPSLVRVEKNGRAIFRLEQDGPVFVSARAGDQIPEGESDFYGVVLRVYSRRQTVVIRNYDLGKPL